MRRPRLTITLSSNVLRNLDKLVDGQQIRNRSHAIEFVLSGYFKPLITRAVILAGGEDALKSLLSIAGKPILAHLIENLKKNGISEIIICTNVSDSRIKKLLGNGEKYKVKIIYSEEDNNLQTGGALLKAKKHLNNEAFLLVHGDILTDFYFKDMIDFHFEKNSFATAALTTFEKPLQFGQLQIHGTKLVKFYQKGDKKQIKSYLVNCGIYVFSYEIFNYFPENKTAFMLEDIIEKLISEKKVDGFVYEGLWFDVGRSQNYEKAVKEYPDPNQK